MNSNKKLEKRLNENLMSVVQKMAERKISNFRKMYKESMVFVNQNWFIIKDTVGPLYGLAVALLAGLSNQPVSRIAKKLKQK